MTTEERFMGKVVWNGDADECWEWQGTRNWRLYGQFHMGGRRNKRMLSAHRFAYELFVGPIPDGKVIDHLCRNPSCVNPVHLEPVTCAENLRRGISANARKTHCPHGHVYSGPNLIVRANGNRACRACTKRRHEQEQERKRNAAKD